MLLVARMSVVDSVLFVTKTEVAALLKYPR